MSSLTHRTLSFSIILETVDESILKVLLSRQENVQKAGLAFRIRVLINERASVVAHHGGTWGLIRLMKTDPKKEGNFRQEQARSCMW